MLQHQNCNSLARTRKEFILFFVFVLWSMLLIIVELFTSRFSRSLSDRFTNRTFCCTTRLRDYNANTNSNTYQQQNMYNGNKQLEEKWKQTKTNKSFVEKKLEQKNCCLFNGFMVFQFFAFFSSPCSVVVIYCSFEQDFVCVCVWAVSYSTCGVTNCISHFSRITVSLVECSVFDLYDLMQ